MNIDFSNWYSFEHMGKRGSFSAQCAAAASADARLDLLEQLFRGDEVPSAPISFRWAEGSRLYDLLLSTLPSYLASTRCFSAFEEVGATGWSTYPIDLRGKNDEVIEGYSGLVVTGHCGPLQLDRSRVETRIGASGKPYKVKTGLYFDEATWDGSDVFAPQGTTFVFVTDKVRRAMDSAKISNVTFTPLNEFERLW